MNEKTHENPLVSVVMAAYNAEEFIRPALESLFAQDWDPFETIVVDDGSSDATAEIAESFSRVNCIRQENGGAAAARNAGAAAANGEFVANFDSDDLLPPTRLTDQVSYLIAHPEVGCVFGRQEWLNPSAMFRREVLLEFGGYDTDFVQGEDTDLLIRMRAAGIPYHVLPDVVLYRRFHESSLTGGRTTHEPLLRSLRANQERERAQPDVQE